MSDDPVIDRSRVDSYLRSRHRVEVLNASWLPNSSRRCSVVGG